MSDLDTIRARIFDRTPLLGASRRKQAAESLAAYDDGSAAQTFAEALVVSDDAVVVAIALQRLEEVTDLAAIDAVCAVWARTRHPRLADLLGALGWVAREPLDVRVLGTLANGGAIAMQDATPELVPGLVAATEDADTALADAAWQALESLQRPDAREALCDLVIDDHDMRALKVCREQGYMPEATTRRALFLLLTDQDAAYLETDPDGGLLAEAIRVADPHRRQRIADHARENRLAPWARAVLQMSPDLLESYEWEALLLVLAEQRDFATLWALAPLAPAPTSVGYLRYLKMVGWEPPPEAVDRGLFHKLMGLVPRCTGDPDVFTNHIKERRIFEGKSGQVACLALSPDWRYLALGGDENTVRVYSLPDGALVAEIDDLPGWTRALSFGASGKYLAIATMKHQTRVYQLPEALPVTYLDTRDVVAVALRNDGRLMATASGQRVDLWDIEAGTILRSLPAHGRLVKGLVIGVRGCTLASWGADHTTRVWQLPDGQPIGTVPGDESGISIVALSPDESRLAIADGDHAVRVFSLPDGEFLAELPGDGQPARALAFRPDGEVLAIAGHNGRIRLFTIPNGDPIGVMPGYVGAHQLAWNGLGQLLAVSAEGKRQATIWAPAAPPISHPDSVTHARPEEIAWAQRLHKDVTLGRDERAWLTYWGTLVLAARGLMPVTEATAAENGATPEAETPHPWEGSGAA